MMSLYHYKNDFRIDIAKKQPKSSSSDRYFSKGNFKLKCELCPFETFDNEDGLIGILFHLALKHEVN